MRAQSTDGSGTRRHAQFGPYSNFNRGGKVSTGARIQFRKIPAFILQGCGNLYVGPEQPVKTTRNVVNVAALDQALVRDHPPVGQGCLVAAGEPIGRGSLPSVAAAANPTGKKLAIVAVAFGVMGVYKIGIVASVSSRDVCINTFAPEIQILDTWYMRQIYPRIQCRLQGIEQWEWLGFAHCVSIDHHRVP